MKKLLFLLAIAGLTSCGTNTVKYDPSDIVLDVKVENMTVSKAALQVNRTTGAQFDLDKNGEGTAVLKGVENVYANLRYGDSAYKLFLQKGDRVKLTFDGRKLAETAKFEGKNADAVSYINQISYESYSMDFTVSIDEYMQSIEENKATAKALLKTRKLNETNPEFSEIENARIDYMYLQSLLMYPIGHMHMSKNMDYVPNEAYYETLKQNMVEIEALCDVNEYREYFKIASEYISSKQTGVNSYYEKNINSVKYLINNIESDLIRQKLIASIATEYLQNNGIKNIKELQNLFYASVTDSLLINRYKREYTFQDPTAEGRRSPDFSASDINGKPFSLKDFRGKYLYIDMWATWCSPCKAELPYLMELEKKFEGKNIHFLGLSIDKDSIAWANKVSSETLPSQQLYLGTGSKFQEIYEINTVPRFILLDKEGNIVNASMMRPSTENIDKLLNQLDGI